MSNTITLRMATPADAPALRAIYLPYVRTTAVTFELHEPTLEEFAGRVERTLERYPYIVAECEGELMGFAYASAFRPRAGYQHAAETSIYVRTDRKGGGVGRRLYETLEKLCALQNVHNLEACIAYADPADEYVPPTSRLFHEKLGYTLAGTFKQCARKFDRWYDMIWMEKEIKPHEDEPKPFVPFPEADQEAARAILADA